MIQPSSNTRNKFRRSPSRNARPGIMQEMLGMILVLLIAASGEQLSGQSASKENRTYTLDMTKCAGFSSRDAAQALNLPVAKLTAKTEKMAPELWKCSFSMPDGKGVSFSVSIARSTAKAAEEMEQLRGNLEIAAETAPFKNKLPQGAYSEILTLGEESVWTDINGTLTVRKGNITIQVLMPAGKKEQIKIVQAFLTKF